MSKISNQHYSKSLEKGFKILSLFNQSSPNLSLKEISQKSGIIKTSAFNYVNTMVKLGYLSKDERTKMVKLGPKAIALGRDLMAGHDIFHIIKKFSKYVTNIHDFSVDSIILDGNTLVRLYVSEISDASRIISGRAEESWHCSSLAKSLLAFLPEEETEAIMNSTIFKKHTEKTITSKKNLIADLEKVRKKGYATNNEEFLEGFIAIGAPFYNLRENRPIGAVSFDFFTSQYSLETIEQKYSSLLLDLARDISEAIPV